MNERTAAIKSKRGRRHRAISRMAFVRDGWRCVWCGSPVSDALPPNHDRKATGDHVLPLSLGGEVSLDNTVTACRKCNVSRGNRAAPPNVNFQVEGSEEW